MSLKKCDGFWGCQGKAKQAAERSDRDGRVSQEAEKKRSEECRTTGPGDEMQRWRPWIICHPGSIWSSSSAPTLHGIVAHCAVSIVKILSNLTCAQFLRLCDPSSALFVFGSFWKLACQRQATNNQFLSFP